MKRTQQEILDRIEEVLSGDLFGFKQEVLIPYLDFENAQKWLVEGTTKETWDEARLPFVQDGPAKRGADYLGFAIKEIRNQRGISGWRSVSKFAEWAWLDGLDDLAKFIDDDSNFRPYGEPAVRAYADHYNLEWR